MVEEHIEKGGEPVRDRLLEAALEVFNRKGYAAASVREIVNAAGVTKPSLYYYFGSKEGLYLAILQDALDTFRADLVAARGCSGTARECILRLCERTFALSVENIQVVRLIHATFYGPAHGAPTFDLMQFHGLLDAAIGELVVAGIRAGEFRDGDATAFTAAIHGTCAYCLEGVLCGATCNLTAADVRQLIQVVIDGIGAPTPRS